MRALWDLHPQLPYSASAPWPKIYRGDYFDWESSVAQVDSWLRTRIGARWVEWTWGWSCFGYNDNHMICTVNFSRDRSCSLFLLQYG